MKKPATSVAKSATKPVSVPVVTKPQAAATPPLQPVAPPAAANAQPSGKPVAGGQRARRKSVPAVAIPVPARVPAPPAVIVAPLVQPAVSSVAAPVGKKKSVGKKNKPVRDSFTMPEQEYARIAELKERVLRAGLAVKKSELLRAGLVTLSQLSDEQLKKALQALDKIKTGRPAKK